MPKNKTPKLSSKTMKALRKLVAESIAYGKTSWNRDEQNRDRKAWDELDEAGLTTSLMYEHESLKPKAIRLVIG